MASKPPSEPVEGHSADLERARPDENADQLKRAQRGLRHMAVTVGAPLPTEISLVVSNPWRA